MLVLTKVINIPENNALYNIVKLNFHSLEATDKQKLEYFN